MSPIDSLRMNLRNSLRASDTSVNAFARQAGVSATGLRQFLAREYLRNPKRSFVSKIENAMRKKNWKQLVNPSLPARPANNKADLEALLLKKKEKVEALQKEIQAIETVLSLL